MTNGGGDGAAMRRDGVRGDAHGRIVDLRAPREVVRIARRLTEAGHTAWAVGGAVRDSLAGLVPTDWDLTTSAKPGEVRALFRRTVPIGIEHGTVGVLGKDGKLYEVTTHRRDVETFGRRARVAFADTLEDDLDRRDFTINAVAWNPLTHEVRDPHGGVEDLRDRKLRTVGDPATRFAEDRLRVFRALRFAGSFDLEVEPRTWDALRASADKLGDLSAERIRDELFKVLRDQATPSTSLRLYACSGVLEAVYPELYACVGTASEDGEDDVWTHLLRTVDAIPRRRAILRPAALLHDVGKPSTRIERDGRGAFPDHAAVGAAIAHGLLSRLKCSNAEIDRAVHLIAQHSDLPTPDASDADLRRWVQRVGREYVADLFRLGLADRRARAGDARYLPDDFLAVYRRVKNVLANDPPLRIEDLAIDGADLRALGIPPGPVYGEILRDLLDRVIEEPAFNERERLLSRVRDRLSSDQADPA